LGIPIFQEQAIKLAMVAAGFTGGKADELRRAMANWGKDGKLIEFEKEFIQGMLNNDYSIDFANRLFEQIKGFSGYGFPESHSASFALLCYYSSWFKCHHPAIFYCALLNSQPLGFYSPSQLIQDAQRHHIKILPIDINVSQYDNILEETQDKETALRLGFIRIKGISKKSITSIINYRKHSSFKTIEELREKTDIPYSDIEKLASADVFHSISGNRFQALWTSSDQSIIKDSLISSNTTQHGKALWTKPPSVEKNIILDHNTTGISLRPHIMSLLRKETEFKRCIKQKYLHTYHTGRFVQVAGLVTGKQRPGTAKGTVFLTLEDETGNINIVVWKTVQDNYRAELLNSQLLLIKGRLEVKNSVVHIIAGQLIDHSSRLSEFDLKTRDFY